MGKERHEIESEQIRRVELIGLANLWATGEGGINYAFNPGVYSNILSDNRKFTILARVVAEQMRGGNIL